MSGKLEKLAKKGNRKKEKVERKEDERKNQTKM